MPAFSDDEVVDYMIVEALAIRNIKEENDSMKQAEEDEKRKAWATDFDSMRQRL